MPPGFTVTLRAAALQIKNTRPPIEVASVGNGNELVAGATAIADKKCVAELAVPIV